jgi:hypothetical protein
MDVLESGYWVVWVTEIPNVQVGELVVIISNEELSGYLRIPHKAGLSVDSLLLLLLSLLSMLIISHSASIIVIIKVFICSTCA